MAKPVPAEWNHEGVARRMIANALGYESAMAGEAYRDLLFALRDGDILARITAYNPDNSRSDDCRIIEPSFWKSDANGEAIHAPWTDEVKDAGHVEINIPSVLGWLEGRRKPCRPRDTGYQKADAPFVDEMARLLRKMQASNPTDAAWQVIKRGGSRVPGGGTDDSKVSRLVKRFKGLHGE